MTLTGYEVHMASLVGLHRRLRQLMKGRAKPGIGRGEVWGMDIEAACAELAFAKEAGLYWGGSVDTFKLEGDVVGYEVRRAARETDSLIIRPGDHKDRVYVLMIGTAPEFRCAGWIAGDDAMEPEFWRDTEPGAWFVPQESLGDLTELSPCSGTKTGGRIRTSRGTPLMRETV